MNNYASLDSDGLKFILANSGLQIKQIAEHLKVERHTISDALLGKTGYFTPEQRKQILESRKLAKIDTDILADSAAGMTDVDVAAKYYIHRKLIPVIKQRARNAGIEVIEYEDILKSKIKVAISEGRSLVKIAEELKISRSYINTLKATMGLAPKFKRPDCKGKKRYPGPE